MQSQVVAGLCAILGLISGHFLVLAVVSPSRRNIVKAALSLACLVAAILSPLYT